MTAHAHGGEGEVQDSLARAEEALAEIDSLPPPATRAALEAVEAVVRVYADALGRFVDICAAEAPHVADRVAGDDLLSHLLLLHELHPHPVERRVNDALEAVRPDVQALGADVELVDVALPSVRVRIVGAGGCGASPDAVVEEAVRQAAPEVEHVELERATETVIPVDALLRRPAGDRAGVRA